MSIKDRVAIIGAGCSKFGEHYDKSAEDLVVEAGLDATERRTSLGAALEDSQAALAVAEEAAASADPYQEITSLFFRKDYFLARVANDFMYAVRVPQYLGNDALPDFDYQGSNSYEDLSNLAVPNFGMYLATPNPDELRQLFRRMAKRISFRLIK